MNLQQIIDEHNALHQSSEEVYFNPHYIHNPIHTAEVVFSKYENNHSVKEFSAVLALLSLADYEDGFVKDQYEAWFSVGCFKSLSPAFIEDIDDLDKFEQAKFMHMICGYILEQVVNEQATTA